MRNYCKIIGALAAASAFAAGNASAVELDYNLHAGYSTQYLFRGNNLGQDLIEAGSDASADLGNGSTISAGAWYGSFDAPANLGLLGTGDASRSTDELDLYAKFSQDLGWATVSVGYIYYFNNQSDVDEFLFQTDDTQEITFGISREFFGVDFGLTYYWEIEDGSVDGNVLPFTETGRTNNDGYTELTAAKSWELNSCLTLNVGSALGYLVERGHLAHLTTKVSLDYEFAEHAQVSPFIAGSLDLSGGHGDYYGNSKNQLLGGVIVSVDF